MSRVHGILMLILKGKHLLIKLFIQCIKFLLFRCFSCWLSGKLIWAFAAPVLFVILVSTFSLLLLFTVYQKDLPDQSSLQACSSRSEVYKCVARESHEKHNVA